MCVGSAITPDRRSPVHRSPRPSPVHGSPAPEVGAWPVCPAAVPRGQLEGKGGEKASFCSPGFTRFHDPARPKIRPRGTCKLYKRLEIRVLDYYFWSRDRPRAAAARARARVHVWLSCSCAVCKSHLQLQLRLTGVSHCGHQRSSSGSGPSIGPYLFYIIRSRPGAGYTPHSLTTHTLSLSRSAADKKN